ncbi:DUF3558 domain-containing protein [Streptomyces sp. NPDC007851]|uniref:DUF3558 domain-containing protein n=1 Tax=Streptomyces sp. NPDC007851 TaxID=3155008 RepID=UPI0033DB7B87
MQRVAVQRDDQRARNERNAQRRAGRLRRSLVCAAAVPAVALFATACSSNSDNTAKETGTGSSPATVPGGGTAAGGTTASPTVQAAKYQKLPEPCAVLSQKTLTSLVPKGVKSGKKGTSDDVATRGSCSWSSLDNNGVKGSQFRWLNVSFLRFDSDAGRGSGDKQAEAYYTSQVQEAQAVTGAKNTKSEPVSGAGDQATAVRYDLKKKEGAFKQQTVVARVANVVVTVDYNGAGLAGEKTPDAGTLTKAAVQAVKEAVASVSSANGPGAPASSPAAPSKSPSKSPSKPASESPSASASPSKSSAKKS